MEAFSDTFAAIATVPALVGLFLTGVIIFLTSDWRLSLAALLIQYILTGLTLTRFIETEVAVVKILVGVIVVLMLYLSARHVQEVQQSRAILEGEVQLRRLRLGWDAGWMGLLLRFLVVMLVVIALTRLFSVYSLPLVSTGITFVAIWLASMGVIGLVLGGGPLRLAPALLTIMVGFDLVYTTLEPSLAIAGFFGTLVLLTGLAFSYLAVAHGLGMGSESPDTEGTEP